MKKFFIVALSVVFCLCLVGPAMAKVQMGGMITFDSYYWYISDANASGGVAPGTLPTSSSLGRTQFNLSLPLNRLNAKYTSDDGMIGGFIEIRGGGSNAAATTVWNYGWIDWRFNPNVYLRVGRQTQAFAIMAPQQMMGWGAGGLLAGNSHIVGLNFGNIHGGSARDSIRLYWKFNDMIRMELQAMDPDSDPTGASAITLQQPATVGGGTATEENAIPRFDLSLPITVGNFVIEPSFTWTNTKFANTEGGDDDDFNSYGAAIGVKAGFGPVILGGEFTYGRNLGGANYVGAANWNPIAYDMDGDGDADKVEDTDGYAWWFHFGFKLGPATPFLIIGNNSTDNDGSPVANDPLEFDIDHWMYGISVPISVAKGFTIRPEFMYYDYDDSAEVGGVNGVNRGDQWMLGVQWQLTF